MTRQFSFYLVAFIFIHITSVFMKKGHVKLPKALLIILYCCHHYFSSPQPVILSQKLISVVIIVLLANQHRLYSLFYCLNVVRNGSKSWLRSFRDRGSTDTYLCFFQGCHFQLWQACNVWLWLMTAAVLSSTPQHNRDRK